jgi:hypothetical protein
MYWKANKSSGKLVRMLVLSERMDQSNTFTEAQIQERRTTYRNSLSAVMGEDSDESQQNGQHLEWAYESFVFALHEAGAEITEEVLREVIPAEVLRLAIEVNWIPYLDEDGEPYPEKTGNVDIHGYGITQEFYDAFLRLLPSEDYIEYAKQPWAHPTPEEIVTEVQQELGWGDQELIEAMQEVNGTKSTWRRGEQEDVDWRDSKERFGLKKLRQPPPFNARPNKAQVEHRKTTLQVIHRHSKKYANLTLDRFNWQRP